MSRVQLVVRSVSPKDNNAKGGQQEWRIRVGDWRVVYTVDDVKLRVSVTRIRHRSEVYEG
jgi:mRNA-degrading endonuclease RelE of RelBE toxin-antitoxin system